jgi:integrase
LPDEEKALLDAAETLTHDAGPRTQWLITAALETGCRVGELLALQWADVDLKKRTVFVRAIERGARKTGRSRLLPMSARLAAMLEMAQTDAAGRTYPPLAYVFGVLGQRLKTIKKAWETCVLRAHGHEPEWVGRGGKLSETCRAALRVIDLHFHDLRHEAGSRWLEASWPLHHVRAMLGHANISQTDTYLHAAEMGLQDSMRRFDNARGKPVVKKGRTEHLSVNHTKRAESSKGLLH